MLTKNVTAMSILDIFMSVTYYVTLCHTFVLLVGELQLTNKQVEQYSLKDHWLSWERFQAEDTFLR